jgi:hypothetical protein
VDLATEWRASVAGVSDEMISSKSFIGSDAFGCALVVGERKYSIDYPWVPLNAPFSYMSIHAAAERVDRCGSPPADKTGLFQICWIKIRFR